VEVCLRAVIATLIVAGSINACDNGAAERAREQDREEERVRKAERDAINSAKVKSLQEQFEDEKDTPTHHRGPMPPLSAEVESMLSSLAASARPKVPPPACTCKASDPLCDCL